jgi:hypothetical protein
MSVASCAFDKSVCHGTLWKRSFQVLPFPAPADDLQLHHENAWTERAAGETEKRPLGRMLMRVPLNNPEGQKGLQAKQLFIFAQN